MATDIPWPDAQVIGAFDDEKANDPPLPDDVVITGATEHIDELNTKERIERDELLKKKVTAESADVDINDPNFVPLQVIPSGGSIPEELLSISKSSSAKDGK